MTIYYEVRPGKTRRGPIKLVTEENLQHYRGFRSVYGFPQETADLILSQGNTRNLSSCSVYSNVLLVDFDNNEAAANASVEWLEDQGVQHSVWHSGGRSIHIHVTLVPMRGLAVPYKQRVFVERTFPGADLSFYHTSGMFRLPGTFHESNPGNYKKLLIYTDGDALNISATLDNLNFEPKYTAIQSKHNTQEEMERMLNYQMFKVVQEGGRNRHAYNMARLCIDLGYSYQQTTEVVKAWNDFSCIPPLSTQELNVTVRSAYQARKDS